MHGEIAKKSEEVNYIVRATRCSISACDLQKEFILQLLQNITTVDEVLTNIWPLKICYNSLTPWSQHDPRSLCKLENILLDILKKCRPCSRQNERHTWVN